MSELGELKQLIVGNPSKKGSLSPVTLRMYELADAQMFAALEDLDITSANQITSEVLESLREKLAKDHSPAVLHRIRVGVRRLASSVLGAERLDQVWQASDMPNVSRPDKVQVLSPDQSRRLRDLSLADSPRNGALVGILLDTGAEVHEVAELTRARLILKDPVAVCLTNRTGKYRYNFLSEDTSISLLELLDQLPKSFTNYIFTRSKENGRGTEGNCLTRAAVADVFIKYREGVGVEQLSARMCRNTKAFDLGSVNDVSKQFGINAGAARMLLNKTPYIGN